MKVQRKTVWILTIISIISSIFVIGVYLIDFEGLSNKLIELIKTIASGIFTGAVLALVTTLILYFNEKKEYMEKVIQYSRIYYQTLQNTIQDCKNVLTSYDEENNTLFVQNLNTLFNRINSANTYLSGEKMIYKEEFQPLFKSYRKNKCISENIEKLIILYSNMNSMERKLSLEFSVRRNEYIKLFFYIKNFREQLRNEKAKLNSYLYEIDRNYNNSVKWNTIIKSIDDFIVETNDSAIDRTIDAKAERLASSINIDTIIENIKNYNQENPDKMEMLKQFGLKIEKEIIDNSDSSK